MKNWASLQSAATRTGSRVGLGLICVGMLVLLPTQILAQGIVGRVLDSETDNPIPSAVVVLTDVAGNVVGQAVADARGSFSIFVGQQGNFIVSVEMLGYEAGGSGKVSFSDATLLDVDLLITPVPLVLEDFTVTGNREAPLTYMQKTGFYERRARGFGDFIEATEHQREHMMLASDFVRRVPGLSIIKGVVSTPRGAFRGAYLQSFTDGTGRQGGVIRTKIDDGFSPCPLKVLVDGMDMGVDLDFVASRVEVAAMEVYKSFATVPARWQNTVSRGTRDIQGNPVATCGLILVWTRHS